MSSPARRRQRHMGSYGRHRDALLAWARSRPGTRCWRCGLTASEHGRDWNAGHIESDDEVEPWVRVWMTDEGHRLAAECERCNTSHGARSGNRMRRQGYLRRW
jgi:hypothetical protein